MPTLKNSYQRSKEFLGCEPQDCATMVACWKQKHTFPGRGDMLDTPTILTVNMLLINEKWELDVPKL